MNEIKYIFENAKGVRSDLSEEDFKHFIKVIQIDSFKILCEKNKSEQNKHGELHLIISQKGLI